MTRSEAILRAGKLHVEILESLGLISFNENLDNVKALSVD